MREAKIASTLVNECLERTGLPWPRAIGALGLVLFLLLVGAAYVDGVLDRPFDSSLWRLTLLPPALLLYVLSMYHLLIPLLNKAVNCFRPLVTMDQEAFNQLVDEMSTLDRRREWLFILCGGIAGAVLALRLWDGAEDVLWMKLYCLLVAIPFVGLMSWAIYASLAYAGLVNVLHRQPLEIDIFNPMPFEPIANWGLGVSSTWLGGITLSVLLTPNRQALFSAEFIALYGVLILVSVPVFFLILTNTHRVMDEAKERELQRVRHNLAAMYQEWTARTADGRPQDMSTLADAISSGLAYEKRIEEAPEWPYTSHTLRNLIVSTLLPIITWLAQVLVDFIK